MKTDLLANLSAKLTFETGTDLLLEQFQVDKRELAVLVESAPKEQAIHSFLESHPVLLLHAMLDGFYPVASARSALYSKVKLGADYELDFAYCSGNSMGVWWTFVELERPDMPLFTKSGNPSKFLTHALRQVQDWQSWIADNQEYAHKQLMNLLDPLSWTWTKYGFRRPCNSLIVIWRRSGLTPATNRLRAQMCTDNPLIEIMTYDRLFDDYVISGGDSIDGFGDQTSTMRELQD